MARMPNQSPTADSPALLHPTGRSGDQLAVDRAIAELRRGGVVALRAGPTGERIALVTAAEMATEGTLSRLAALAGSAPALALSRERAEALGHTGTGDALSLALPARAELSSVLDLVDPTRAGGTPALTGLASLSEPADGPAAVAIRLMKLARLLPSALVASVPMLAASDLERWARDRSMLTVGQDAIDRHRTETAARLVRAAGAQVPLADAEDCELIAFRPLDGGTEHIAILVGPGGATPVGDADAVLVRLHSQCLTGDLLGSLRCDCGDQLRGAIREIAAAGGGIVLYLAQEGRDIGLINKLRAYRLQDLGADTVDANKTLGFEDDERVYVPAAEMLRQLGVARVRLLTNNPAKLDALARCGVEVAGRVPHVFPSNQHNERYLRVKAEKSGHLM